MGSRAVGGSITATIEARCSQPALQQLYLRMESRHVCQLEARGRRGGLPSSSFRGSSFVQINIRLPQIDISLPKVRFGNRLIMCAVLVLVCVCGGFERWAKGCCQCR